MTETLLEKACNVLLQWKGEYVNKKKLLVRLGINSAKPDEHNQAVKKTLRSIYREIEPLFKYGALDTCTQTRLLLNRAPLVQLMLDYEYINKTSGFGQTDTGHWVDITDLNAIKNLKFTLIYTYEQNPDERLLRERLRGKMVYIDGLRFISEDVQEGGQI